jgi:tricorn protease-like protein
LTEINTPSTEFTPSVSPDGKWLYFASNRRYAGPLGERLDVPRDDRNVVGIGDGTKGDIYRIATSELGLGDPR